jgi:hypothetical protein
MNFNVIVMRGCIILFLTRVLISPFRKNLQIYEDSIVLQSVFTNAREQLEKSGSMASTPQESDEEGCGVLDDDDEASNSRMADDDDDE